MYNAKSLKAEEFIDHDEVMATLDYAWENRHNEQLIDKILEKAKLRKGYPTQKQQYFWTVISRKRMKKFMHWQSRSRKTFTEIVLSCLRRCIYPTTV